MLSIVPHTLRGKDVESCFFRRKIPRWLLGTVQQLSLGSRQGADVPQQCQVLYLLSKKTGRVQGYLLVWKIPLQVSFLEGHLWLVSALLQPCRGFLFSMWPKPWFSSWFLPGLPLNLPLSFHYTFSFHILSFWDLFFLFLSLSLSSFLLAVCSIQPFQSESSQSLRKGPLCRALSPGFLVEQLRYCPLFWGDAGFVT